MMHMIRSTMWDLSKQKVSMETIKPQIKCNIITNTFMVILASLEVDAHHATKRECVLRPEPVFLTLRGLPQLINFGL